MNTLIKIKEGTSSGAAIQTMSSIEIAEVCGKQHKNVMRDIKQIFTELKFEPSDFSGLYKDSTGRTLPCYNLPKRECLILVSGYSTALRAKIIDRWQELEKQAATPQVDYSKPEALLGVLNHLQSQIEQKDHVIAELAPKAEALKGLKRSDGLFGLIEAAKMLEVRPKDLTDYFYKNITLQLDNVATI
ncbi:Rha family transcriptional regulator [Bartonella henselae]|nr:Rha family transcriptional regulator [Bartonella henselae]UJM42943.1 Rha family transcriptional regulator [Bartonella henselae]